MSVPGSDSDFVAPADSQVPLDIDITPGSRHHMLVTGNEPPDSTDVALIERAVSNSDARLAFLDKEIPRLVQLIMSKSGSYSTYRLAFQILDPESSILRDQMVKWEEERASLLDYRAQNKAVISPHRRIPPEILGEIFLLTLPVRVQEA
ncbi:hypothetical protein B0H13DRAFT_2678126, partial [Mycena leptocephala]